MFTMEISDSLGSTATPKAPNQQQNTVLTEGRKTFLKIAGILLGFVGLAVHSHSQKEKVDPDQLAVAALKVELGERGMAIASEYDFMTPEQAIEYAQQCNIAAKSGVWEPTLYSLERYASETGNSHVKTRVDVLLGAYQSLHFVNAKGARTPLTIDGGRKAHKDALEKLKEIDSEEKSGLAGN